MTASGNHVKTFKHNAWRASYVRYLCNRHIRSMNFASLLRDEIFLFRVLNCEKIENHIALLTLIIEFIITEERVFNLDEAAISPARDIVKATLQSLWIPSIGRSAAPDEKKICFAIEKHMEFMPVLSAFGEFRHTFVGRKADKFQCQFVFNGRKKVL